MTHLFGGGLVVPTRSDNDVCALLSESVDYPFQSSFSPDFGSAVDILYGEDGSQSVEEDFGQTRDKMVIAHQHIGVSISEHTTLDNSHYYSICEFRAYNK